MQFKYNNIKYIYQDLHMYIICMYLLKQFSITKLDAVLINLDNQGSTVIHF